MKRADVPHPHRLARLVPIALVILALPQVGFAQSARFTLIDARDGLTPDVQEAYAQAMGANAETPMVRSRVKIIASARHGADFDAIDLPEHVRSLDLDVDLILQGGETLSAPVDLNHVRLARRAPNRVTQRTTIKGQ